VYNVKGIIFDLDGTLVRLPIDWSRAVRHIEKLLGIEFRSLLELFPKIWETEKYEIISRTIEEYELASLSRLKFLDDSPTLLKELSSQYQLGLVTFQGKNVTRKIIIDKLGISGIPIATRDDNPTRVGQIFLILSNIPLEANEFLVIGDKLNDVYSALEIGCKAILVDRQDRYSLDRNGSGFTVISDLRQLPDLLV
jgi:HAD superfamily hydrolase (TIGR01549 family)